MRKLMVLAVLSFGGFNLSACSSERSLAMGENARELAVGDLNRDGWPDLIAASLSEPSETGLEPEQLLVRLGTGFRAFSDILRSPGTDSPVDLLLGDLDADSNLDAISVTSYGYVRTALGAGDGSLQPGPSFSACDTSSRGGTAADFDQDGLSDVAILCRSSGAYLVTLFSRSGPVLELGGSYSTEGVLSNAVASGDLNGDGAIDLVIAGRAAGGVSGVISHLNDGAGTFQPLAPFAAPAALVELADMNGDGTLDAVVADASSEATQVTLAVLHGNGDGTFAAGRPLLSGERIDHLAVSDLDANGAPDIAVIGGAELHLFIADGSGDYVRQSRPAGENAVALATADFDGDRWGDVAVLNRAPSEVTLHFDAVAP